MSKKQLNQPTATYNECVAYTDGWRAFNEGRKKNDSAFTKDTHLGQVWLQGYQDSKRDKKDEAYFDVNHLIDIDEQ